MVGLVPVSGVYHLGVVVKDAMKSMEIFSAVFGIPQWEVRALTDDMFGNPVVRGKAVRQNFISALGVGGPISLELCQPLAGDRTVYQEFIDENGEGLHHVLSTIISRPEFAALLPELEARGIGIVQGAAITNDVDYWYLDTEQQLGTLIELVVISGPDAMGRPPTEIVAYDQRVTAQRHKLPIDKLYHYAVVSRQPMGQMKAAYEELLGVNAWYDFENKPNETVARPRYNGVATDYKFSAWSGRKGQLGVEIVEPLGGNSMFEEKLHRNGPGMHHLMTTITNAQVWETTAKWLASEGMPIAQDAWTMDGSTYIAFVDARERLAGMYLEVIVRQDDIVPMEGPVADILIGR